MKVCLNIQSKSFFDSIKSNSFFVNSKKVLLVTDVLIVKAHKKIVSKIDKIKKIKIFQRNNIKEPTYLELNSVIKKFRLQKYKPDLIIGLGGGSVMDFSKGLAVLFTNCGDAKQYMGFPNLKRNPVPWIAAPTTAGTGSEIIYNASFVDEKTNIKMGINVQKNLPLFTVLDPYLCKKAPFKVFSSTGCDCLVHIVESFLSPKGSLASKNFSKSAFKLLSQSFPKILCNRGNKKSWQEMQLASVFAMVALSNSSSGPAGAFSYYLGPVHHIPHGLAGAFFLRHILKITLQRGDRAIEKISYDGDSVYKTIFRILDLAKIPKTLSSLGIHNFDKKNFLEFSKKVIAARRLHSIPFTREMVEEMVEMIS